jgi:hypothetical protein
MGEDRYTISKTKPYQEKELIETCLICISHITLIGSYDSLLQVVQKVEW